jgi:hypothetical protein
VPTGDAGGQQLAGGRLAGAGDERRGDVQRPPDITPSAIRRTISPEAAAAPATFAPSTPRQVSGSAATRGGYTLFCMIVTLLVVAALIVYFATR